MKHISPKFSIEAFNCAHCGVFAAQTWSTNISATHAIVRQSGRGENDSFKLVGFAVAACSHCRRYSIWSEDCMVYPLFGAVEHPNPDLPEDIQKDYEEASKILSLSPRGAAALLRLAVQKLCIHLGEKGKAINDDIASLVKKGLPPTIQQAMDSVRIVGNNAVHPGVLDLSDNVEIAATLFGLINVICEVMISQPKKINELYTALPAKDLSNIAKRDGVSS